MYYVELDANNLRRWLTGAIGATGNQALTVNGFTVYFSDAAATMTRPTRRPANTGS